MHISGSVTLRVPSFGDNCQWPCPPYWGCRFSLGWGWGWGFNAWYTAGGVTKRRVAAALPFLYPSPKDPGWRLPSFVAAPPAGGAPPASLPAGSRRGVRVQSRPPADARASWRQAASRPQLGLRGRTRCPRPPPLSARGGAGRARGAPAPLSAVTWGRAQQVSGLAPSAGNAESTPETAALRVSAGAGARRFAPACSPRGPEWSAAPAFSPARVVRVEEGDEFLLQGFRSWGLLLKRSWSGAEGPWRKAADARA